MKKKKKKRTKQKPPDQIEMLSNDMHLIGARLNSIEQQLQKVADKGTAVLGFVSQIHEHARDVKKFITDPLYLDFLKYGPNYPGAPRSGKRR